jgi:hypothetical protein
MESQHSGISQVAQHEWMKTEDLGEVVGQPTREHWKVSISFSFLFLPFPSPGAYIGNGDF